ncbi:MAG: hypothetical protein F4160_02605 [Rhodospirillaceae bacterium]|nr:hypothetical protein [Rhodospirillaceae bacterium]MYH35675.1 hypothetical protein [Rhodospirillaceae bacterium]
MVDESGRLVIVAERGGSIAEITEFLSDLQNAYLALYALNRLWLPHPRRSSFPWEIIFEAGVPLLGLGQPNRVPIEADALPPNARLTLERVRIESPGFWEFLAALNPLQQLREYLNDRHRRRQDREFREASERKRLELENELIQKQLEERDIANLREKVTLLRDLGYHPNEIRDMMFMKIGMPLVRLGRHQDTKLIGGAE